MSSASNKTKTLRDQDNAEIDGVIVEKDGVKKDGVKKESSQLTILSALLFIAGSKWYLIGAFRNLEPVDDNYGWTYNATGAWFFIVCGLVEYLNYMGKFHIALIFAGIFALATELLDASENPASVYCNFAANHMYFLEAIAVSIAHRKLMSEGTVNFLWFNTLKIADLCFVFGASIDSVLSWIYIFSLSRRARAEIDIGPLRLSLLRRREAKIAECVSACLWCTCGLLTLAVYMRMETKPSSRSSLVSKSNASIGTKLSEMC